jgi:peptidoglycan/xylan/chitin deacetylase (PgdA/CDA1 family)/glycosyltransferase involved in cell wall biosynthesis
MERAVTPGRIAAVVTCRDLGRFLDEALDSVERQTRPADEIVVVDDNSEDIYTRQVVARLARSGTYVVAGPGRGASAARNLGARLTSADYLVWVDADDVLDRDYFRAAADCLDRQSDLDFVSCAMRAFGDASYTWTPAPPTFVDAVATGGVPHASTMVRRTLWDRIGGFDEALPTFELLDFWASALEAGARGVILDSPLLNYRVRPGSGYRRSLADGTYRARLAHFYDKHRRAVERHGLELILAKDAFNEGQRQYRQALKSKVASLESELRQLGSDIANAAAQDESRGAARVRWGDFDRLAPFSPRWGRDRGTPIDRYYIEQFIEAHRDDIRGRVLEVREPMYTDRFGGEQVTARDVVDRDPANPRATIVADLRNAGALADGAFDCIVLTQTLQLVDDLAAVMRECARLLAPGGALLATAPSVIRVDDQAGLDGDFWRFTAASARNLLAGAFPVDAFEVATFGNVKACAAFLYGLPMEEIARADLDYSDPHFPLVVAMRAVRPAIAAAVDVKRPADNRPRSPARAANNCAVIVSYHRIAALAPDSHGLCTAPAVFRDQMRYLAECCAPLTLDDLVAAAAAGALPERAVAVTLDDGYLDALTTASPILEEAQVPATFFVNSDRLDEPHERWWDILERIFSRYASLPGTIAIRVGEHEVSASTATVADRAAALEAINRAAWPLDAAARRQRGSDILVWSGARDCVRDSHRVLTADESRALARRPGHTIGAHTAHHLALTCHDANTACREIAGDRLALAGVVGRDVDLFSYPYGDYNHATVAAVREAGFRAAVTVRPGAVRAGTNRLLLPRLEIRCADRDGFDRRLEQLFQVIDRARNASAIVD